MNIGCVCSRQHRLRYSILNFSRIDIEQLLLQERYLNQPVTTGPKFKDIQIYSKTMPSTASSRKSLKWLTIWGPPQAPLAMVHSWEAETTKVWAWPKNAENTRSPTPKALIQAESEFKSKSAQSAAGIRLEFLRLKALHQPQQIHIQRPNAGEQCAQHSRGAENKSWDRANLLDPPQESTIGFSGVRQFNFGGFSCNFTGNHRCEPSGSIRLGASVSLSLVPNVPKCCSVFLYRIVDIWYHLMLT